MNLTPANLTTLRTLEESLWIPETRFDQEYMDKLLSPDFFEFGRSGRVYTRAETVSMPAQKINIRLPLPEFKVHGIGDDTVLVTYRSEVTYDALEVGNRSSIWSKTPTGWQLHFHQGTAVSDSSPTS